MRFLPPLSAKSVSTAALAVASPLFGSTPLPSSPPPEVAAVAVLEHLGDPVPLDVRFRDHAGNVVALSDLVRGKPVILNLMYHRCAMLCSVVLDSLTTSLTKIDWSVGREFDVVTLSIDPHDTTTIAETKRAAILEKYGRPDASHGWTFLVGREPDIRKVADAVGFEYRWDPDGDQWIHPAALFVLTGDGRIARYLYGVDFAPRDLKFALLEASEGRTVSTYDKILLACYHWDPKGRTYRLAIPKITRIAAASILVIVAAGLTYLWRRERTRA